MGFAKAQKLTMVTVVIYENLSRVQEVQLFIDININQKEDSVLKGYINRGET